MSRTPDSIYLIATENILKNEYYTFNILDYFFKPVLSQMTNEPNQLQA